MTQNNLSTSYDDALVIEELRAYQRQQGLELDPPEPELEAFPEALPAGVDLWYPEADRKLEMPTMGRYREGYPEGAIVHYTAGRSRRGEADAEATIRHGAEQRFCYFCISATGKVYQTAPLDRWGSHAGISWHPRLGFRVSKRVVGIEVCCAGLLKKSARGFEPWWNERTEDESKKTFFTEDEVREVAIVHNITQAGPYHAYTDMQEQSLISLLLWLKTNHPAAFDLDLVLGHDEVGTLQEEGKPKAKVLGRKQDPGGSLSSFMPALRERLKAMAPSV